MLLHPLYKDPWNGMKIFHQHGEPSQGIYKNEALASHGQCIKLYMVRQTRDSGQQHSHKLLDNTTQHNNGGML